MKLLTAHDFTQYLQALTQARASQQLEPIRMLMAQYRSVLVHFPHLQEELAAFTEPDADRDYGIVGLSLKQGLSALEKLLEAVEKARGEWGEELATDEIMAAAELYSTRVAQQSLQRSLAALRQRRERERRAAQELARRHAEEQAELRRNIPEAQESQIRILSEARREAEERAQEEQAARDRKRLEIAEGQFTGWRKISREGVPVPASEARWAAVTDRRSGLMWAVNWEPQDNFPNRGELTWYNPDRAANGGSPGNPNRGNNIHAWLHRVNAEGWCGYQDWRIPTLDELSTLITGGIHTYYHIREDIFHDMGGLGSRFWTATPDPDSRSSAYAVYFGYGHAGVTMKTHPLFLRLVRTAAPENLT
ncbi:uncharacterized protein DUF1566 [Fluviicoccus keumensis]|uniref:Uncharacterized protein DUF1566 n=1 Tax=Fluviicoccus keumensis TaxID=1435465 RepID=A0A4Q7ZAT6_9GAMM|nr:DUF1566 domain-containing protein [Fluviicoccus keumensis]RZU47707.1 uncharacterized protein DUF1566 [Fluviicoccus keumensis]